MGVSLDQDADKWKDAIKKLNITWPQMSDLKGWQNEGAQLYAVNSIPTPCWWTLTERSWHAACTAKSFRPNWKKC